MGWSSQCRAGRSVPLALEQYRSGVILALLAWEAALWGGGRREGAGGGAGRKLYVILGWLLSNCFNEMECSVFSACLAETAIFLFSILGRGCGVGVSLFSSCFKQLGLDLSRRWEWKVVLGEGAVALLCVCGRLSLYMQCVSGRAQSLCFSVNACVVLPWIRLILKYPAVMG